MKSTALTAVLAVGVMLLRLTTQGEAGNFPLGMLTHLRMIYTRMFFYLPASSITFAYLILKATSYLHGVDS